MQLVHGSALGILAEVSTPFDHEEVRSVARMARVAEFFGHVRSEFLCYQLSLVVGR